ncbi:carbamoyl-phosphate synthase [Solibacillus sp. FSL R7-0668]|uniref:carbamoyl-phosphate synthase n=1 Tax=Solibacillus sp. FSL R7-0668 TaxID=2921688 RepID=UPI0030F6887F
MADGSIRIDTRIEDNNVTRELRALQNEMKAVTNEMKRAHLQAMLPFKREMMATEIEMKRMKMTMQYANERAMMPFKRQAMETKLEMFRLAQSMGSYAGSTQDFMGQVQALGAQQKKTNDQMINANRMLGMSIIQTAGQMMNMTTQAQRISENYTRMANPMYRVNAAGLAVADTLNRIANNGDASVLALRMLGPNASMKQLNDMVMMINQGLMRFQMVAMAAAVTSVLVYGTMHKAAMDANEGYKKSFEDMTAALKKAMKPLIDVFAMVMIPIFNMITAVAQWVSAFSEAHPTIAKVVAGILLLIPALTLLLSPLAIGIGLIAGMQAAWASVWMLIGPLVTGLAAMSATVWVVAAAITGLVAGLIYLWNNHEGFKNAVIAGWEMIKSAVQTAVAFISSALDKLSEVFKQVKNAFITAFATGDWSQITGYFAQLIPSIIALLVGGIPGLLITAARFIPAISEGMLGNSASLAETITTIFTTLTTFIATYLPIFIQQGIEVINNIITGLVTALPILVESFVMIITQVVGIITALLPTVLQSGILILQAIIDGILTLLPTLLDVALTLITSIITILSENLPMILDAGIQILTTLIEGIAQIIPQLIETAIQLITTVVETLTEMLPDILNAGIEILMALIDGIIETLPKLVETALLLLTTVVDLLIDNLPMILDAGIEILLALVSGIVETLPKLIDCAVMLIVKAADILIKNLPKIVDAGVKLLLALIDGIVKILPKLITCAIDLIVKVAKTLIDNLPKILSAGKDLVLALISGIISLASKLGTEVKTNIVPKIIDAIKEIDLFEIGKDIIRGLINGIGSMASAVWKKAKSIADGIGDTIKGALKIHSPSRLTTDLGEFTGEGMEVGLDNTVKRITAAAHRVAQAAVPKMATATGNTTNTYNNYVGNNGMPSIEPAPVILDGQKIGEIVFNTVSRKQASATSVAALMRGVTI